MSLLMDALKRAESSKQDAARQVAGRPQGTTDSGLSLEPLGTEAARTANKPLPDLASHLESLEADLADVRLLDPPPARPAPPPPATTLPPTTRHEKPEEHRERESVRNAFAVKQSPVQNSRKPLWLALGTLGIAAVGIGGYVFYELNAMNRGSLAVPATPVAAAGTSGATQTAPTPTPTAPQFAPPTSAASLPALPVAPAPVFGTNSTSTAAAPEAGFSAPQTFASPPRAPRGTPEDNATPAIRLAKTPPEADSALLRGHAGLQRGELDLARADYEQSLRRDPNNTDALLALAAIAHRQGRSADAEQLQQRALVANPNDPAAQAAVLGGAPATSDPNTTESRLKGLLGAQPESAPLNFALGNLYARQRRWPEAQQAYFNAVAADGDNPDYLFNLAVSLDQVRQPRLAGQHYRLALEAAEKRPAAFDREQVRKRLGELLATSP